MGLLPVAFLRCTVEKDHSRSDPRTLRAQNDPEKFRYDRTTERAHARRAENPSIGAPESRFPQSQRSSADMEVCLTELHANYRTSRFLIDVPPVCACTRQSSCQLNLLAMDLRWMYSLWFRGASARGSCPQRRGVIQSGVLALAGPVCRRTFGKGIHT